MADRRAALAALLLFGCACTCACESTAPASTAPMDRVARTARDWTGSTVVPAPSFAPAPSPERGTWVLHVGDSFVHASFQQNLRPRFEAAGAPYVVDAATATYTTTWANDPEAREVAEP